MTNTEDWGRATTQRIADEIKRHRDKMTVQALSDRTAELGYAVSRSRISDLERGDRGALLGVAELIVLAKALQIPPIMLLYPDMPDGPVEMVPRNPCTSEAAVSWFQGNRSAIRHDEIETTPEDARREDRRKRLPVTLTQRRARLSSERTRLLYSHRRATANQWDEMVEQNLSQIASIETQIEQVEDQMRDLGLTVDSLLDRPWE